MKLFVALGLLAAVAVWLVACPANLNDEGTCAAACDELQQCGFLPSSLGTTLGSTSPRDNCVARCRESDEATFNSITTCTAEGGDAGACDPTCGSVAKCLGGQFPPDDTTGQSSLQVVPVLTDPTDADLPEGSVPAPSQTVMACSPDVMCPDAAPCPCDADGCGGFEIASGGSSAWCNAASALTARAFVFHSGAYTWSAVAGCADLLAHPPTFAALPTGVGRPGVQVRGAVTLDAGMAGSAEGGSGGGTTGPPFCFVYYGNDVALMAGGSTTAQVFLRFPPLRPPQVLNCEEGTTFCSDGFDNDKNGLTDCSDPSCAAVCADAGVPPLDGSPVDADAALPPSDGPAETGLPPPSNGASDAGSPLSDGAVEAAGMGGG